MEGCRVTPQGSAFTTAAPASTGVTSAPWLIILDSSRGMMSLHTSGTWAVVTPARKTPALGRGSELFTSSVSSSVIWSRRSQFLLDSVHLGLFAGNIYV